MGQRTGGGQRNFKYFWVVIVKGSLGIEPGIIGRNALQSIVQRREYLNQRFSPVLCVSMGKTVGQGPEKGVFTSAATARRIV